MTVVVYFAPCQQGLTTARTWRLANWNNIKQDICWN